MSAVTVSGLQKSFGGQRVLKNVDLRVPDGSVTAVLGPSGCGKTTLLRIIAGFVSADGGSVTVGERAVVGPGVDIAPDRRGVGYVPQEGALFPHLNVAKNIFFGVSRAERTTARLAELLELAELPGEVSGRFPHELSGGQQQRVALARALAPKPRVILLDEPFSSLDASLRESAGRAVVRVLRAAGAAAMLVTHDQGEALSLADQVAVMRAGDVVQMDSPSAIYERPVDLDTALFVGGGTHLPAVVRGGRAETVLGAISTKAPDGNATVLIRPEQVGLVPTHLAAHSGKVEEVTYYGAQVMVRVALDEHTITARASSMLPPQVGEPVGISITGPVIAYPAGQSR